MGLLDKLHKLKAFCDRYRNIQIQHALLPGERERLALRLVTAERERQHWSERVDELTRMISENADRSVKMDKWLAENYDDFAAFEVAASEEIQQYATKLGKTGDLEGLPEGAQSPSEEVGASGDPAAEIQSGQG
ncbi:MAG: hypothetical protein H0X04_00275 [Chthoniobacterales bacterium]|nr:hypothetical protein [Chthoniobacterales bacterium]